MIQPKSLEEIIETKLTDTCNVQESHMWTINEVYSTLKKPGYKKLPVKSFNHVAREVISIEESRKFYVEILGFDEVDRPQLDCEGIWLFGYGLSVHLIGTKNFKERQELKRNRIKYFSTSLPVVDHIAFVTEEIDFIKKLLDEHNVFYKSDSPYPGMNQVFFFDPDGNVCYQNW